MENNTYKQSFCTKQTMLLITTNHYSMQTHKAQKSNFFFQFKKQKPFKQSKKLLIWREKKIYIAGSLPFFLPVKYPKSQGKNTIEKESLIQKYLT